MLAEQHGAERRSRAWRWRPVRGVDLHHQRRRVAGERPASESQASVPPPGGRCRSRRSGSSAEPPPSRRRAPRLSWTWKSADESSTGETQPDDRGPHGRRRRSRGRCRAASARPASRVQHELANRLRVVATLAGRIDRAQVLQAEHDPERLRPARKPAECPLLGLRLGPRLSHVEGVVDDIRGASSCAYSSSPSPARLWSELPEPEVGRAVHDYAEAGDVERSRRARPCRTTCRGSASISRRRRGDLDPAESGRLDRLECCRTRPPLVRHVEAEPIVQPLRRLNAFFTYERPARGKRNGRVPSICNWEPDCPICGKLQSRDHDVKGVNRDKEALPMRLRPPLHDPPQRGRTACTWPRSRLPARAARASTARPTTRSSRTSASA